MGHRIQAQAETDIRLAADHPQIRLRQSRKSLLLDRAVDEDEQRPPREPIGLPGEQRRIGRVEHDAGAGARLSLSSLRPGHSAADPCRRGCRADPCEADAGRSPTNLVAPAQAGDLPLPFMVPEALGPQQRGGGGEGWRRTRPAPHPAMQRAPGDAAENSPVPPAGLM